MSAVARYAVVVHGKVSSYHADAMVAVQEAARLRACGFSASARDEQAVRTRTPTKKGSPVIVGFRVRCAAFTTRTYTSRSAADDYLSLALRDGHADATIEVVRGVDDAGGLCGE